MSFPLPHESVPMVDPKTGKITEPWLLYFAKEQAVGAAVDPVNGSGAAAMAKAASAETIALQAISRRIYEQSGLVPQSPPGPIPRRQWSEVAVLRDTEANQGNYLASTYPDGYYIATDSYKTWYSAAGAWVPIYGPQFFAMLGVTNQFGALKEGNDGVQGILMARLGDDSGYADLWVLDEAYGSGWNGDISVPTKNAVYDKIETLVGRYTPLFDHFADVGNVGTGEDDLYSDTLAAGQLAANGDKVLAFYGGIFAFSATATSQIRVYFAGTEIFDTGALAITVSDTSWDIEVEIIRVSASVVRCSVHFITRLSVLAEPAIYTEITGLTLANTQVLKITGESAGVGAGDNDIVAKLGGVAYSKAA